MLDIKLIRKNKENIEKKLKTKDPTISLDHLISLDEQLRNLILQEEQLQAKRNSLSQEIGKLKREKLDPTDILKETEGLGEKIQHLNQQKISLEEQLLDLAGYLPNLPADHIKISHNPQDNVCLKTWGEQPSFNFPFKNHVELNNRLNLFDFQRAAKTSGSGWPAYRGLGARLEWALLNYLLDIHLKNGFELWIPPLLVRPETLFGSAHLPKFESQLFKLIDEDHHLYLIPTAEAVLNGLHADEILEAETLPRKYVSYTPCFRREAGAAGSQERGLIRTHQFNKVEMFIFCLPEESEKWFQTMVSSAEEILQGLNLHYRNMLLVTGDMSFASTKTIDVEVWLPGQNRYYEVSSISDCGDFQARRSKVRYKTKNSKPEFVHTLNGSGVATSRLMVAILENNQQPDGSVKIPSVLHPYLKGITELRPTP